MSKGEVVPADIIAAIQNEDQNGTERNTDNQPVPAKRGFQKGKSGNPAGRPKGSLGKSTLLKQAIMAEAEGLILNSAPKVIRTVIEQAKKGCLQSQKLLWTSLIPAKKAVEISASKQGPPTIKINIETLVASSDNNEEPVEAEFEVIEDDN